MPGLAIGGGWKDVLIRGLVSRHGCIGTRTVRKTQFANSGNIEGVSTERCSKLQLKLNGNYSSLREILAPSLRDHNGSLRAVNFSNGACATLREDEVVSFRALLLARCRREAVFGLGFLGFSDSRLT